MLTEVEVNWNIFLLGLSND